MEGALIPTPRVASPRCRKIHVCNGLLVLSAHSRLGSFGNLGAARGDMVQPGPVQRGLDTDFPFPVLSQFINFSYSLS